MSRRQLLQLGFSSDQVDHRRAMGRLRPVFPGVYAVGHRALAFGGLCHAAQLMVGPKGGLSHFTAAKGLGWIAVANGPLHVTARHNVRDQPGLRCHRSPTLRDEDLVERDGLRFTSPARTARDLAMSRVGDRTLERLLDAAVRSKSLTIEELRAYLAGRPRNPKRLTRIVEAWTPRTERTRSSHEKRLLTIVRRYGLPVPELNVAYELPNGEPIVIDAFWREQRVACEIDTLDFHDGAYKFHDDRERDAQLTLAGLRPLRLTDRHLARPRQAAELIDGILACDPHQP